MVLEVMEWKRHGLVSFGLGYGQLTGSCGNKMNFRVPKTVGNFLNN
jgi:hypothetical protein